MVPAATEHSGIGFSPLPATSSQGENGPCIAHFRCMGPDSTEPHAVRKRFSLNYSGSVGSLNNTVSLMLPYYRRLSQKVKVNG